MWPFSNRSPRFDVEEVMQKQQLDFDFAPFKKNGVSIKLWLPEKIVISIDVLSIAHDVSRPDVLRWIFFEHVYGRELFLGLCAYAKIMHVAVPEGGIRFSRKEMPDTLRAVNQQFLGKATEDIKLWMPGLLKEALNDLAVINNQTLSDYLRSVLTRHLFGESFYLGWQQALIEINQQAVQHEN